jgi:hypothetical protein
VHNLSAKHIQVLQGIRRSGKSTIFKLLINTLVETVDPREILYLNLEDPFFIKYNEAPEKFYEIVEIAQKVTGKKPDIFSWTKYRRLQDGKNSSRPFMIMKYSPRYVSLDPILHF